MTQVPSKFIVRLVERRVYEAGDKVAQVTVSTALVRAKQLTKRKGRRVKNPQGLSEELEVAEPITQGSPLGSIELCTSTFLEKPRSQASGEVLECCVKMVRFNIIE